MRVARAGGLARADRRHDRGHGKLEPALDVEQRRGRIDLRECRRIAVLANGDKRRPEPLGFSQLRLGLLFAIEMMSCTRPPRRDRTGRA